MLLSEQIAHRDLVNGSVTELHKHSYRSALQTAILVASSSTETQLLGLSLPANCLNDRTIIRFWAVGKISTGSTPPTTTWNIRIGPSSLTGRVLATAAPTVLNSLVDRMWLIESVVTVVYSGPYGTLVSNGMIFGEYSTLVNQAVKGMPMVSSNPVDTTVANTIELTFKFGTASSSNRLSSVNATIECIDP